MPIVRKGVNSDRHIIEGFVSMDNPDRDNEIILPEAFGIEKYMVNPQVWVDHRKWKDAKGNEIPVGRTLSLYIVLLRSLDGETMVVEDEKSGSLLGIIDAQKVKALELKEGSRGLWARIEILEEDVWKLIEDGRYNTFSWQGHASLEEAFDYETGGVVFVAKEIDLWEISVVALPANEVAYFSIAKSLLSKINKTEKENINKYLFSKSVYKTVKDIEKAGISKGLCFAPESLKEINSKFVISVKSKNNDNSEGGVKVNRIEQLKKEFASIKFEDEAVLSKQLEDITDEDFANYINAVKVITKDMKSFIITKDSISKSIEEEKVVEKSQSELMEKVNKLSEMIEKLSVSKDEVKSEEAVKSEEKAEAKSEEAVDYSVDIQSIKKSVEDLTSSIDTYKKSVEDRFGAVENKFESFGSISKALDTITERLSSIENFSAPKKSLDVDDKGKDIKKNNDNDTHPFAKLFDPSKYPFKGAYGRE
jgi:hypothetical protein